MRKQSLLLTVIFLYLLSWKFTALAQNEIPKAAWRRPIGLPLENSGTKRVATDIDDGYWQGAPVGGFGSGTFSRTYRGDFARWHIKAGVHKYETVYANQFAMFQQAEGDAKGTARVLMTGHPQDGELGSWEWNYPTGAGEYAALYPKSWYDYKWDKFPAHVVLEQFSPVLPDDYQESSYPVAVYRWHADNPTNRVVTVSVLLSLGGDDETRNDIRKWHDDGERAIRDTGIAWTVLRPGAFMSNALHWRESIRAQGKVFSNYGHGKLPPVHPRDIAAVAVRALTSDGHEGKAYPLTGPEALSISEQVKILEDAIGQPLEYVPITDEAARKGMEQAGMPSFLIDALVPFAAFIRSGKAAHVFHMVEEVTGRPPLRFSDWTMENAAEFR